MFVVKRVFQFLGLNDEIVRFLTLGLANNLVLFFYSLHDLLFRNLVANRGGLSFLGKITIVVISTFCFSKIFQKRGILFQEKILNGFGIVPTILYPLILLELFLTINLKKTLFAIFGLEICFLFCIGFHFQGNFAFKFIVLFVKHLFLFDILSRSLINKNSYKKFSCIHLFLYNYMLVQDFLENYKRKNIRIFLTAIVFFLTITNYKISSLFY